MVGPAPVALACARQASLPCPAPVAIHDDAEVLGDSRSACVGRGHVVILSELATHRSPLDSASSTRWMISVMEMLVTLGTET
ncbi:hypothetical protein GCM10009797_17670 [Nocardioides hwasunensis]